MAAEIANVACHHHGLRAELFGFRRNRANFVAIEKVIQRNVIAAARERQRDCPADPPPRAGDEGRSYAFPQNPVSKYRTILPLCFSESRWPTSFQQAFINHFGRKLTSY